LKPRKSSLTICGGINFLFFAGFGGFAAGFVFGRWFRNFETFRYGFKGFSKFNTWSQDKGHETQFAKYIEQIEKGEEPLISYKEIVNSTLAGFAAVTSGNEGRSIVLNREYAELLS
jgi:hypothetical protein